MHKTNTVFYTGHCTGDKNLRDIQIKIPGRIHSMNIGMVIKV